jgi:hypothetical protein
MRTTGGGAAGTDDEETNEIQKIRDQERRNAKYFAFDVCVNSCAACATACACQQVVAAPHVNGDN